MNKSKVSSSSRYRRYTFFTCIAVILICCTAFAYHSYQPQESIDQTVATVNGEAITTEELQLLMMRNRGKVFDYFKKTYAADINEPGFWRKSYSNEVPEAYLKQIALNQWIRIKVQQSLAMQYDLIKDPSFTALIQAMQEENGRRKRDLESNKVIMGMKQYDPYQFLQVVLTDLQTKLKDQLQKQQLKPTDAEIQSQYEELKERHFRKQDTVTFQKIFVENPDPLQTTKEAKSKIEAALQELQDGASFEAVAEKYNKERKVLEDVISEESLTVYRKVYGNLLEIVPTLQIGEISGIFEDLGGYYIIKCIDIEEQGYYELAEVNPALMQSIVDTKYEHYIDTLVKDADIHIVEDNFENVKAL